MRIVGLGLYWNDLTLGEKFRTIGRTITEADIVNFVGVTGMTEVLFTDLEYLKEHAPSMGRVAPGALVGAGPPAWAYLAAPLNFASSTAIRGSTRP